MDKKSVVEYFSKLSPHWDANAKKDEDIINIVLDKALVAEGKSVLDV